METSSRLMMLKIEPSELLCNYTRKKKKFGCFFSDSKNFLQIFLFRFRIESKIPHCVLLSCVFTLLWRDTLQSCFVSHFPIDVFTSKVIMNIDQNVPADLLFSVWQICFNFIFPTSVFIVNFMIICGLPYFIVAYTFCIHVHPNYKITLKTMFTIWGGIKNTSIICNISHCTSSSLSPSFLHNIFFNYHVYTGICTHI